MQIFGTRDRLASFDRLVRSRRSRRLPGASSIFNTGGNPSRILLSGPDFLKRHETVFRHRDRQMGDRGWQYELAMALLIGQLLAVVVRFVIPVGHLDRRRRDRIFTGPEHEQKFKLLGRYFIRGRSRGGSQVPGDRRRSIDGRAWRKRQREPDQGGTNRR